jgi:protein-S-isoprenylcysteine O-methyltransferase Ste14
MFDWRYWLVVVAWIVWDGYWILSARGVKRAASKEPWTSRGPVVLGLVLSPTLLLAPGWFGNFMGQRFLPQDDLIYVLGILLLAFGVYWAFWARHTLGSNWSGRVTIKQDHELVTVGPYRFVRHPIYTGVMFAFLGSAIALGRVGGLFALGIMLAIFFYKMRLEEKVLDQHFGNKYADYRKITKTLIPLVW